MYGGLGYQFIDNPDAFEQLAWTAGISYSWKSLTLDVRYWGTDLSDEGCTARSGFPNGCDIQGSGDPFLRYGMVGSEGLGLRKVIALNKGLPPRQ